MHTYIGRISQQVGGNFLNFFGAKFESLDQISEKESTIFIDFSEKLIFDSDCLERGRCTTSIHLYFVSIHISHLRQCRQVRQECSKYYPIRQNRGIGHE